VGNQLFQCFRKARGKSFGENSHQKVVRRVLVSHQFSKGSFFALKSSSQKFSEFCVLKKERETDLKMAGLLQEATECLCNVFSYSM
jgi:hypothetical protein